MALILAVRNRNNEIKELLHNPTVTVDGNNKYGTPFKGAAEHCTNNLERCVDRALRTLYGNDEELINQFLAGTGTSFKNGRLEYGTFAVKSYALVNISNKLQETLDNNYNKLLAGKTIEEFELDCKQAYNLAYGKEQGSRLAQAFIESQMKGVHYIKTGIQGVGMLLLLAGQLIPVGGQAALVLSGVGTATFGGTAVQLTEDLTKAGGITEEDKKAILKELGASTALLTTGAGIGKMSSLAYSELVMANCPRLLAFSAKIGTDATMSLLADMIITGEVDLTSEGISQLIPIVTGILKTRGSMQKYLNQEFLATVQGEAHVYFSENPEKLGALTKTLQKNQAPLGHIAKLDEPYWKSVITSIDNPPTGVTKNAMMDYKRDSWAINKLLSCIKTGEKIPQNIQQRYTELTKYIADITDYINTLRLTEPITVYRDDGYILLTFVKLPDGNTLADKLQQIAKSKDINYIHRATENLSAQTYPPIVQERFMSTTFVKDLHYQKQEIRWEFNLPVGTKGTFIESYNELKIHGNQVEYLLQRNSKIIIKNINYLNGQWYIKADIQQ